MKFAPIHRRTLEKAANKLGGEEALADYLGVSTDVVRGWMNGSKTLPFHVFSAVVDFIAASARREKTESDQAKELR